MADLYEAREQDLRDYTSAFEAQDHQVGAVFAINGRALGVEIFDSASSYAAYASKLVVSYALDAIDYATPVHPVAGTAEAAGLLQEIEGAAVATFPGVGLGESVRLEADDLAGAALVYDGRLVHLCGFRLVPAVRQE